MKKTIFTIVVAALTAFVISSFKNTPQKADQDQAGTEEGITFKHFDKNDSLKGSCEVFFAVDYPMSGNEKVVSTLRSSIAEWIGSQDPEGKNLGTFTGDLNDADKVIDYYFKLRFDQMANEYKELAQEGQADMMLSSSTEVTKDYETEKFVTLNGSTYIFLGGAHGSDIALGVTVSKLDGQKVTWDMFTNKPELMKRIEQGLGEYFKEYTDEKLEDCLMLDDLSKLQLPTSDPVFMKDGIHVTYQQYEIAAYAAGMPSFVIPYVEAEKYLNDAGKQLLP